MTILFILANYYRVGGCTQDMPRMIALLRGFQKQGGFFEDSHCVLGSVLRPPIHGNPLLPTSHRCCKVARTKRRSSGRGHCLSFDQSILTGCCREVTNEKKTEVRVKPSALYDKPYILASVLFSICPFPTYDNQLGKPYTLNSTHPCQPPTSLFLF